MSVPLLRVTRHWVCQACPQTAVTTTAGPHTQFHQCPGMHGMAVPMTEDGADCTVELNEREDYIGSELVQYAPGNGRPYMSAVTRRGDGSCDTAVYAPVATAGGGA